MISPFEEFQELRKILCICPCCNEIVRVSDLHLKVKGPAVKTWLDEYDKKVMLFDKKEESFDARESKIKERSREEGRKLADKIVNRTIPPIFKSLKADSADIIPLCHPIDYLLFKGMSDKDKVSDIVFISKKSNIPQLNSLRKQISQAVDKKSYSWHSCRIDNDGKLEFE